MSATADVAIGLHGHDAVEGVLSNLRDRPLPRIGPRRIRIDYGASDLQVVTFDERGQLAQAMLT